MRGSSGELPRPRRGAAATAIRAAALAAAMLAGLSACRPAPRGLVVGNAAALGPAFRALGDALVAARDIPRLDQENAPSLEVVRRLTELGKPYDVLGVADVSLLDSLVLPRHADWYLVFAGNALVIAYGPRSAHRADVGRVPWHELLLRPGVRVGRSDPRVDPSGYRALLALQLAERFHGIAGLEARLRAAMPERFVRHAEADLSALVQSGDLDYIWTYRNLAAAHGLDWIELPPELSLEDPARGAWYAQASLDLPGGRDGRLRRVRGAPIVFGLTIPRDARSPELAERFVTRLLSPEGAGAMQRGGLRMLERPRIVGGGAPAAVTARVAAMNGDAGNATGPPNGGPGR